MCHIANARKAAKSGYALSELIDCPGFFFVHKADGTKYLIDFASNHCDCPASVTCKHIGLVEIARRFVAALERKARKPRRHFSRKHIEALRRFAPVMAGTVPAPPPAPVDPERIARRERIAAMILRDFGPAH